MRLPATAVPHVVKNPESSAALRVWEERFYRWHWNFVAHEVFKVRMKH